MSTRGKLAIATVLVAACAVAQDPLNRIDVCMSGAIETLKAGAAKTSVRCELEVSETVFVLPSRPVTRDEFSRLHLSDKQIDLLSGFYEAGAKPRFCTLKGAAKTSDATDTPGQRKIGETLCIVSRIDITDPAVITGSALELEVQKSTSGAPTLAAVNAAR